jgi:hypothetical protein
MQYYAPQHPHNGHKRSHTDAPRGKTADDKASGIGSVRRCTLSDDTDCPGQIPHRLVFQRCRMQKIRCVCQHECVIPFFVKFFRDNLPFCRGHHAVSSPRNHQHTGPFLFVLMQICHKIRNKAICHGIAVLPVFPDDDSFFFH